MTVESEISREIVLGDGTKTECAIPFYFLSKSDLKFIRRHSDGSEHAEVPQSVTGEGNSAGGTANLSTPLLSGQELHIIRWPAKTQLVRLVNANNLPPETVEQLADRLLMLHQANWQQIEKSVRLPETYKGSALTMPEPVTGKASVLGFDQNGEMVAEVDFKSLHDAATTARDQAVTAASQVNNPLDKTQNLADLPDKAVARQNLETVGTKSTSRLETGVTVDPLNHGNAPAVFKIDHQQRPVQTLKITRNLEIQPDDQNEGVTELLLLNDATGGFALTSTTFSHGLHGSYDSAPNQHHHLISYSVRDDDNSLITWGYLRRLGL